MSLIKFLTSKVFVKQLVLALLAVIVLVFILLKWLNVKTNHGEFETVPDLRGKSVAVAKMELKDNSLEMVIQDSSNYNPDYPPYSVIEQDPIPGAKVKENRKIYISLNPSNFRKIEVPDLIEETYRQAKPTLEALGFKVGEITYEDNIGKDRVLQMKHKGSILHSGTMLPKTSTIDL
ncbi:MAG: PASTA domain-containing protein, partial [Flavobacteriaceae bacterium]|nr:PASTA domain-containing protein [Flavobacteriaceae bacterium]